MQALTKTFSLGTITYRMPNIIESMRILGKLGFNDPGNSTAKGREMALISTLIENMSPFISKIEAIKGDEVITDWESALNHMEFLNPLSEIAGEILVHFAPKQADDERKNS